VNENWEGWTVQSSRDGNWWTDETSGPKSIYDTQAAAMAYASLLLSLHPHVRLRHSVVEYINVREWKGKT
jgi:hypothetical protein